jgi:hypothetical protein
MAEGLALPVAQLLMVRLPAPVALSEAVAAPVALML